MDATTQSISLIKTCWTYLERVTHWYLNEIINKKMNVVSLNNSLKRRCQHPSNKFEILWQVAQNSFSLLLSYFVAQYVLINAKIYFSFREMTFFVRALKYANFHREYYPSYVTSCNECTRPTVFL